jgi:2-succinyl-5-enolpyruvyl-6-hydroxy-3-cyclohexene-1-carboxylate synthase
MYGGRYRQVASWDDFRDALAQPGERGLRVIEMATERSRNVVLHRELWAAVSAALASRREVESGRPAPEGVA